MHGSVFVRSVYALIILNVIAIILQSYEGVRGDFDSFFYVFELISVLIFTTEYIIRIWVSENRWKFVFSAFGLIDLVAILPFYLPFLFNFDLRIMRILRLFRMLRVFKLGRYSTSLSLIGQVLKDTKAELLITLFVALILLVFSSTLMYYAEHDAQPDKFASIGHSFWWAVATLTTVGYGDVYPLTGVGKVLSAIIALIGIGFVALPTGIISTAFAERVKERKSKKSICPYCGNRREKLKK